MIKKICDICGKEVPTLFNLQNDKKDYCAVCCKKREEELKLQRIAAIQKYRKIQIKKPEVLQ